MWGQFYKVKRGNSTATLCLVRGSSTNIEGQFYIDMGAILQTVLQNYYETYIHEPDMQFTWGQFYKLKGGNFTKAIFR
jgi:hypothetical protein